MQQKRHTELTQISVKMAHYVLTLRRKGAIMYTSNDGGETR